MNWYYVDQGKQAGPVDDLQLDALRASGRITDATLVWKEGMGNWAPYRQARQPGGAPAPATSGAALASSGAAGASTRAGATQVTCAQCGGVFPAEDTIRYGTVNVCANCKPVFLQKLAEGAKLHPAGLEYATIWKRFLAMFADGILLWIVGAALGFGLALVLKEADRGQPGFWISQVVYTVVGIGLAVTYETLMIGAYGATLGKMAVGIRVVTAEGGKVSYARACGRYFAKMLSQMICLIGYLMAVFDKEERRALHDRICNTRVVVK
ncbi:MAG TPA: RDD family protein [Verrucomicrobiae bacterium]|nr:RDD family protein [Verrucomicrobiae bacterium]